jgi:diacylglycerol kinase (ATP)
MITEKNIAIACNPLAGAGRSVPLAEQIAAEIYTRGISRTLFLNNWPENFNSFTEVWIVGGDGTLNYFFNKYPGIKLPLAVFNGGTGNDVHSLLYKNKTFEEQLQTVLTTDAKPIDAGRCNEKYFLNGVGIGFEGAILRNIFFYTSKKYKTVTEEYKGDSRNLLISVMNGHRAGGGFHIAPSSAIDDGLLDVVMVDKLHPFQRLRWMPVIEKGAHLGLPFIKYFKTEKIVITSDTMIDAHLDGEYYAARRLEIEILPGKYFFRF